jgi:hypothetical protein
MIKLFQIIIFKIISYYFKQYVNAERSAHLLEIREVYVNL